MNHQESVTHPCVVEKKCEKPTNGKISSPRCYKDIAIGLFLWI